MAPRVVVGLADRPGMDGVLAWGLDEAAATGARLVIVRAEVRSIGTLRAVARDDRSALHDDDPFLARAVTTARGRLPDDRLGVVADRDLAGSALVRAARAGDLVVLGAPTVSGWWGRGSTTYHVMTRALCPVVAVHDPSPTTVDDGVGHYFHGQVVVGVDGSPAADAALEFAFAYADRHRIAVVAATAAAHPVEDVWFDDQLLETHLGFEPPGAAMLGARVEPWHLKHPEVAVRRAVVAGDVVDGLRRASHHAALLVVGTAANRLSSLGRVSQALVERAGCPVAVVRIGT
jgi:nucleotide-binding universal stress UspA family protein